MEEKRPAGVAHITDRDTAEPMIAMVMKILREEFKIVQPTGEESLGRPVTFEEWLAIEVHNMRGFLSLKDLLEEFGRGPANWKGAKLVKAKVVPDSMVN